MKKKIQFAGLDGAANTLPENTLESIQKTLELGATSIEVNVHLCDSGELVVIQDSNVDETTNGMGDVEYFTLEELKKLRIQDQYQIPSPLIGSVKNSWLQVLTGSSLLIFIP